MAPVSPLIRHAYQNTSSGETNRIQCMCSCILVSSHDSKPHKANDNVLPLHHDPTPQGPWERSLQTGSAKIYHKVPREEHLWICICLREDYLEIENCFPDKHPHFPGSFEALHGGVTVTPKKLHFSGSWNLHLSGEHQPLPKSPLHYFSRSSWGVFHLCSHSPVASITIFCSCSITAGD